MNTKKSILPADKIDIITVFAILKSKEMYKMTKNFSLLMFILVSIPISAHARKASKEREKYVITDKDLRADTEAKRKIIKRLKVDQLLDILEEIAIVRFKNQEFEERIKVYQQLEENLQAQKEIELTQLKCDYEEKLKKLSAPGSGEVANDEFLIKIKKEGIDPSKVKYRVQIGEVSTYKAAEKLKNQARSLGVETWILPLYNGYVIPLESVLDCIKKNKC